MLATRAATRQTTIAFAIACAIVISSPPLSFVASSFEGLLRNYFFFFPSRAAALHGQGAQVLLTRY